MTTTTIFYYNSLLTNYAVVVSPKHLHPLRGRPGKPMYILKLKTETESGTVQKETHSYVNNMISQELQLHLRVNKFYHRRVVGRIVEASHTFSTASMPCALCVTVCGPTKTKEVPTYKLTGIFFFFLTASQGLKYKAKREHWRAGKRLFLSFPHIYLKVFIVLFIFSVSADFLLLGYGTGLTVITSYLLRMLLSFLIKFSRGVLMSCFKSKC